jgi:hypothetical protein
VRARHQLYLAPVRLRRLRVQAQLVPDAPPRLLARTRVQPLLVPAQLPLQLAPLPPDPHGIHALDVVPLRVLQVVVDRVKQLLVLLHRRQHLLGQLLLELAGLR